MDVDRVWSVLKWILAALAAGFVGQFGRSLALRLIDRKRRQHEAAPPFVQVGQQTKLAKKLAKAQSKRAKKSPSRRLQADKRRPDPKHDTKE